MAKKNSSASMYKAYDAYDPCSVELLGTFSTLAGARAACKEREQDTDGECYTMIDKITITRLH